MYSDIQKLSGISTKPYRLIIGLMSGTSLDGLDITLCKISGYGLNTSVEVLASTTMDYDSDTKDTIKLLFAKEVISLPDLAKINAWLGTLHGNLVNKFLLDNQYQNNEIDVIASHGQTVMHQPKSIHIHDQYPNATLQIGDGDHIAVSTGIITISDFRQKHVARGGEGAPLAVVSDRLLFQDPSESRILLNIGGIANFTYLPSITSGHKIVVLDCGPGNTLIDSYIQHTTHALQFDNNGSIASEGTVIVELLEHWLSHPYFAIQGNKTTGQEIFNLDFIHNGILSLGEQTYTMEDIVCTLTHLTVECIAREITNSIQTNRPQLYVSGGGAKNNFMMELLKNRLTSIATIHDFSKLGFDPDSKEAILMAILANEQVAGRPLSESVFPFTDYFSMGKISFP